MTGTILRDLQTRRKIEPFGDYPPQYLIGNRTLAQHQKEVLRALDLEPIQPDVESEIADLSTSESGG